MMIVDVICDAESEHVIYFLLVAYIEAARFPAKLPENVLNLPIQGLKDVETRVRRLATEVYGLSEGQSERTRVEVQDALNVFDTALERLTFLQHERKSLHAVSLLPIHGLTQVSEAAGPR